MKFIEWNIVWLENVLCFCLLCFFFGLVACLVNHSHDPFVPSDFESRKSEVKTKRTHSRLRSTNHSKECYVWCKSLCVYVYKNSTHWLHSEDKLFLCCWGPDVCYITHTQAFFVIQHDQLFSAWTLLSPCRLLLVFFFIRFLYLYPRFLVVAAVVVVMYTFVYLCSS